ncbi:MAG: hypothetical protein OJI67_03585, partial [Prosthecobacter sp.]|nr:hypothetical protein [Prosthecobacter sp.]
MKIITIGALGALQLSEALMINSTLFKLNIDIPITLTPNREKFFLGKRSMNQLEKHILPRNINNDPDLTCSQMIISMRMPKLACLTLCSTTQPSHLSICLSYQFGDREGGAAL